MLAQSYGLNKNRCVVYPKQVNFMVCKLYLNKAFREEKDSALPTPTRAGRGKFTKKVKERAKQNSSTKGGAQKGPLSSPGHYKSEMNSSCRGQGMWPQPWFPSVSKPPG